jgi:hypothetical protein
LSASTTAGHHRLRPALVRRSHLGHRPGHRRSRREERTDHPEDPRTRRRRHHLADHRNLRNVLAVLWVVVEKGM